jgi:hypothetical protein
VRRTPLPELLPLLGILGLGVVLRVLAIQGPGHSGDIGVLTTWAQQMAHTGLAYYDRTTGQPANYPPLLYLLWPIGLAFQGDALRVAIRALSIPFDVALGAVLFAMARSEAARIGIPATRRVGEWAAALYVLNPATIIDGPLWGQVDGIGVLPMVGALWAAARGRWLAAGALAVLAGLLKPQFAIAAFVVAGVVVLEARSGRFRPAALAAVGGAAAAVLLLAPLRVGPRTYVALIRSTADRFHFMSVSGFNPWLAAFGYRVPDGAAETIGLGLTAVAIVGSLLLLLRRRDLVGLLAVAAVEAMAVYFLPTRVHERHLFGVLPLLAPLAALLPPLRWPFVALSAIFSATLLDVLATVTPPAVPIPPTLAQLDRPEIVVAVGLMIAAAAWCLFVLARATWTRAPILPAASAA